MNTVKQKIAEMFGVMDKYEEFGASDTEPRAVFSGLLEDLANGQEPEVPSTARGWQLFSDMEGNEIAAAVLHDKAIEVLTAANADHLGFREAIEYYYGWTIGVVR